MIKDRPYDREVQVTVIYPEDMNVLNVQELAGLAVAEQVGHGRPRDGKGQGVQALARLALFATPTSVDACAIFL